ncbi:CLUMA_CG005276, isoform A [Clunio marinus]|uniref:CLUMA_CG005276, isoform A n=1 Tax=Clunio marinus TaxID=568069 RepID=A0A1J1HYK7_9DIPT|nr:CLUMA_CG005276, isoform A [Clunio marinus]
MKLSVMRKIIPMISSLSRFYFQKGFKRFRSVVFPSDFDLSCSFDLMTAGLLRGYAELVLDIYCTLSFTLLFSKGPENE